MAEAGREAGAEIRGDAEVEGILTTGGRATGVRLADGEELSGADGALATPTRSAPSSAC